jgi:hypothetical protein
MKVIGLCGYGGTGKDEVGRILIEECGYTRFAKGDLIKAAAWNIDPLIRDGNGVARPLHGWAWDRKLYIDSAVERIDALKEEFPEVRVFLQRLADDVVGTLGRDVWNDALWKTIHASGAEKIVLTRLSLPEEADQLKYEGGYLVRVNRPGFGPANNHPNEVALDGATYDATVNNMGTLDDLTTSVKFLERGWQ